MSTLNSIDFRDLARLWGQVNILKNYKYKELLEISNRLNYIQDITTVLDAILFHSRRLTNADAGTIYLKKNDELVFSFTQNETLMTSNLDNYHIYQNLKVPIDENSIAGYVCYNKSLLNISNVYKLSNTLSYHFNDKFDKKFSYQTKSILTSPILDLNNDSIGVIQLINAKNKKDKIVGFNKADEELIENFSNIISVHIERTHLKNEMILRMIKMAELRDPKETGPHVERVGAMSAELYEQWALKNGIDKKEIKKDKGYLHLSAKLHDVGKIAISDLLLKKPERFNDSEFKYTLLCEPSSEARCLMVLKELEKLDRAISMTDKQSQDRWEKGISLN